MDNTSRMIRLLGSLRREMNGAVVDTMRIYGRSYGVNYGVSLPTIRSIARAEGHDHAFARYLYVQQVRELRLAALHIAAPQSVDTDEACFWAEGIINSEIAEEAAFALLRRTPAIREIYVQWSGSDNELLAYSALMAASRSIAADERIIRAIPAITSRHPSSHIIAQGVVALLAAAYETESMRPAVGDVLGSLRSLQQSAAIDHIIDEMKWRTEMLSDTGQ